MESSVRIQEDAEHEEESLREALLSLSQDEEDDEAKQEIELANELISLLRKVIGETLASFIVVFTTLAVRVNTYGNGLMSTLATAIFGGLIITITIFTLGHVSGSPINPIVTIAYTAITQFPLQLASLYLCAQFIGGILASLVIKLIFRPTWSIVIVTPEADIFQSLLVEAIASFFLLFVASSVATDNRAIGQFAGLAIGAIVAINIMIAGPISGAGLNPARVFGTALLGWEFQHLWIYFVGPIIGGLLGALLYSLLRPKDVRKKGVHNHINIRRIKSETIRRMFTSM